MNKLLLKGLAIIVAILASNVYAVEFGKPVTSSVILNQPKSVSAFSSSKQPATKTVTLMNIKLTAKQKNILHHYPSNKMNVSAHTSSQALDLGMNGVPVLDQGTHGSCVTFANTAAIDALLKKGDYVSQLCNLELGSYFELKGYVPGGWDGSWGSIVLNQMFSFGIINKDNQRIKACGGLKEYPVLNPDAVGEPVTLDEFKEFSENINNILYWEPMLTFLQRWEWDTDSTAQADKLLEDIKKMINSKTYESRITFATMLPIAYCSAGACARHNALHDTWALTKTIKNDVEPALGGHEIVITGYDDNAIAIDNEGAQHQGLLILRNSWGTDAGDNGNYYMTYDFFKQFVMEVQKVVLKQFPLDDVSA